MILPSPVSHSHTLLVPGTQLLNPGISRVTGVASLLLTGPFQPHRRLYSDDSCEGPWTASGWWPLTKKERVSTLASSPDLQGGERGEFSRLQMMVQSINLHEKVFDQYSCTKRVRELGG